MESEEPSLPAVRCIAWLDARLIFIEQRSSYSADFVDSRKVILGIENPVFSRIAGITREGQENGRRAIGDLETDVFSRIRVVRRNPIQSLERQQYLL